MQILHEHFKLTKNVALENNRKILVEKNTKMLKILKLKKNV